MANITLSTSVSVCEDTSESFDLKDLIQQAGGTAGGSPLILQIYVQDGSGNYIPAPAGSFLVKTDSDTITVDLAGLPNFNGDLPIRILGTDGAGNLVTLSVAVQVQPVNDAPDGADNSVSIGDDAAYVFGVGDFGFVDAVEGHGFQGVVIDSCRVAANCWSTVAPSCSVTKSASRTSRRASSSSFRSRVSPDRQASSSRCAMTAAPPGSAAGPT